MGGLDTLWSSRTGRGRTRPSTAILGGVRSDQQTTKWVAAGFRAWLHSRTPIVLRTSRQPPRAILLIYEWSNRGFHSMSKAIVDPGELRRFANDLKRFNETLHTQMATLHGRMVGLGSTW